MNEYSDEWALAQQALAFDGDEAACWKLIVLVKPYCLACLNDSSLERKDYDQVWSKCIETLALIIASGNTIGRWFAYAKRTVRNCALMEIRRETRRRNAEERYMEDVRIRFTEAYPAVRECVELLEPFPHDLIHRMYFRPVRQNMLDFALEHCANYYSVRKLHQRTLERLRGMLMERGICHA